MHITVWNEYVHERKDEEVQKVYPTGIHEVIADYLSGIPGLDVTCATLDMPEHGLTEALLAKTDVLIWWGHMAHHLVDDAIVQRVYERVINDGMGMVFLHSGHASKPFMKLMGTDSGRIKWREEGERTRVWVIEPNHPICEGLPEYFDLPQEETYGERFDIPAPDELIFISWFEGGEVFRSGCCYNRGHGRVFYFQPGHETYPIYYDENVRRVILNAARWAAPTKGPQVTYGHYPAR